MIRTTRTAPSGASARRGRRRWAAWLALLVLASVAAVAAAGWLVLDRSGRTPAELIDHAERHAPDHGLAARVARPLLAMLRSGLGAPAAAERAARFVVPPPPARRGADAVIPPDPAPPAATVWRVGPMERLTRIADAARLARDGDVVEIAAGDYRGDVAVWPQQRLTIRGVGGAARLYADGRDAEGKAIWVIRGGAFDISNIDFIGARVQDGNGAGIRLEGGALRLRHCLFWDNQMGLLTAGAPTAPDATLRIESSEFAYSHVRGRWGHNLYVGTIASLSVTGSYFHHAGIGHLLKSRARHNDIRYNRFDDGAGGQASYELDFPNGGEVRLVGNLVHQQRGTENGTMVSFGEEGYAWPHNTLQMASNTFVNHLPVGGRFVLVAPGADQVVSANNLRVGRGRDQVVDTMAVHNDHAMPLAQWPPSGAGSDPQSAPLPPWRDVPLAGADVPLAGADVQMAGADGAALTPVARYVHPMRIVPLGGPPRFAGAQAGP